MAIPPAATRSVIVRTVLYWVGLTALFTYFAVLSFRTGSHVSLAVWALAAAFVGVYLPWLNRSALRALLSARLRGAPVIPLRTDESGRVTFKCPACGNEATADLAAESVRCPSCGMKGRLSADAHRP